MNLHSSAIQFKSESQNKTQQKPNSTFLFIKLNLRKHFLKKSSILQDPSMLDGWYCRSMANAQAASATQNQEEENDANDGESGSEDSQDEGQDNSNNPIDYKTQSRYLKRKLKFLIYENEFFQDALRSSQRRLLKVSRDRSFLLDRLLQYEKPEITSSESDETESSDEEAKEAKKRKAEGTPASGPGSGRGRKKKVAQKIKTETPKNSSSNQPEGHMTAEEVERHLQSRQSLAELVPERAPPTVPTEMFSNEPSLDSESNDQMIETSPSNIGEECLSVEYNN